MCRSFPRQRHTECAYYFERPGLTWAAPFSRRGRGGILDTHPAPHTRPVGVTAHATSLNLLVEPSIHFPLSRTFFLFGGLRLGAFRLIPFTRFFGLSSTSIWVRIAKGTTL